MSSCGWVPHCKRRGQPGTMRVLGELGMAQKGKLTFVQVCEGPV